MGTSRRKIVLHYQNESFCICPSGLTHGGVVTGVDYSNGVVSGVGAIGNRAYAGHLGYANHVVAAPAAYSGVVAAPSVYSSVVPTTAIHGYAGHYYGKREADSDADAYTIGQVAAGLPVHNAYATGHPHNVGVVTGTTYSAPVHHGYTSYAAPAYTGYAGHLGYAGLGYAGLGYTGAYYG